METLTLASPAKINLFLEVLGKRDDGYHEIRSVLQLIDLCDTVTLRRRERGIEVEVDGEAPSGGGNLAYAAAELFFKEAGGQGGVAIRIDKRIPVGGGLGGGSSNAAATLWGLKVLYGLDLDIQSLTILGGRLGADVPFFFSNGIAFASGRGEELTPLPPFPSRWVVVANPGIPISTAWAYHTFSSDLGSTRGDMGRRILSLFERGEVEKAIPLSFNHLEEVILKRHPEVARLKSFLASLNVEPALMTGSGSSVFGMVEERHRAEAVVERLKQEGYFAVLCRTLDHNPIFDARCSMFDSQFVI